LNIILIDVLLNEHFAYSAYCGLTKINDLMGLRPIIFDVLDGSKGQIVLSTKVQKKI